MKQEYWTIEVTYKGSSVRLPETKYTPAEVVREITQVRMSYPATFTVSVRYHAPSGVVVGLEDIQDVIAGSVVSMLYEMCIMHHKPANTPRALQEDKK